ncbi:MAG: hypothetical protein QG623_678, partial [Patescibacteria group bacterium]|nr:hypothetical protein [Patescibacteria group bacterium]
MEPTQNNQQQYSPPESSFDTTPPPTPSSPPTEPIPPKASKKPLLIIVGLVFAVLIGIGLAYLIFGKENNISSTKQEVPTDQTSNTDTNKSSSASQSKKITEWGVEVPTPRTPDMIYKISTTNNTETLLLSSKELKDLISTKCPNVEENQQYPVAITRYSEALPTSEE